MSLDDVDLAHLIYLAQYANNDPDPMNPFYNDLNELIVKLVDLSNREMHGRVTVVRDVPAYVDSKLGNYYPAHVEEVNVKQD